MSRIKTIETKDIAKTVANGGCGERRHGRYCGNTRGSAYRCRSDGNGFHRTRTCFAARRSIDVPARTRAAAPDVCDRRDWHGGRAHPIPRVRGASAAWGGHRHAGQTDADAAAVPRTRHGRRSPAGCGRALRAYRRDCGGNRDSIAAAAQQPAFSSAVDSDSSAFRAFHFRYFSFIGLSRVSTSMKKGEVGEFRIRIWVQHI